MTRNRPLIGEVESLRRARRALGNGTIGGRNVLATPYQTGAVGAGDTLTASGGGDPRGETVALAGTALAIAGAGTSVVTSMETLQAQSGFVSVDAVGDTVKLPIDATYVAEIDVRWTDGFRGGGDVEVTLGGTAIAAVWPTPHVSEPWGRWVDQVVFAGSAADVFDVKVTPADGAAHTADVTLRLSLVEPLRTVAATAPFVPQPSSIHTLYDLTAEGFTNGATISTLEDFTGNGRDATQTGTARPVAATHSGVPCARFDGTNDYMDSPVFTAVQQNNTWIMLARWDGGSGDHYFHAGTPGRGDGVGDLQNFYVRSGGTDFGLWSENYLVTGGTPDNDWHVFVTHWAGLNATRLYVDGVEVAGDQLAGNDPISQIRLGASDQLTGFLNGDINYVAFCNDDMVNDKNAELNSIGEALADRAGITWTTIPEVP